MSHHIKPCLWMDGRIEEAVNFYVALFKDGKIHNVSRYPDAAPPGQPNRAGQVLTMNFEIQGQHFMALNGGPDGDPMFKFTEAVSFYVPCKDQAEVDRLWSALTANGGEESMCGWLKDRYGLSWQIVPDRLIELTTSKEPGVAQRASQAMFKMRKIDIAELERAAKA